MNPSPLRAVIHSDVDEATKYLKREVIDPWMFFNSKGVDVPKADGRRIRISGTEYSGSAVDVFWSQFADEWLQRKGKELIELTRVKATERRLPVGAAINTCLGYIDGMIQTIYHRMADVDQALRGGGNPQSVARRDVSDKIERNRREISDYATSEIESHEYAQEQDKSHSETVEPMNVPGDESFSTGFPVLPRAPWYRRYWKRTAAIVTFVSVLIGFIVSNYPNIKEIIGDVRGYAERDINVKKQDSDAGQVENVNTSPKSISEGTNSEPVNTEN